MLHRTLCPSSLFAVIVLACASSVIAQAPPPNPFLPPQASLHYAPDREYDLKHVILDLKVDYSTRTFRGTVENQIVPFKDGLAEVSIHCGKNLDVESCSVNGAAAGFTRVNDLLKIKPEQPLVAGKLASVVTRYNGGEKKVNNGFMADSGFHWIKPNGGVKTRVGFWTQGEPDLNREWIPTWDYPNNLATSETRTTVPADWYVVGNGTLKSNTLNADGKTRTFDWQMPIPCATYLISLVGGPFDMKTVPWRGIPVMYVVPKGEGGLIDDSFGDTPDMLSFYSDILGVKYCWQKYAEDAMYDFGGGMENVSATTLQESALTDKRSGFRDMASLNAHELAHQWFGDMLTCRDWGHIWLNESFATFMQALYFEHSRGPNGYAYEISNDMQEYIGESKRYKRPIATDMYPDADRMFDGHTYPKGASVLHTLRRKLGDKLFFAGLKHYLETYQHTPVVSADLCRAMTDATGVDCEPFWQQWIYSPGHPVLDYTWNWDDTAGKLKLTVKQTQDTKDGTPVYALNATVGVVCGGKLERRTVSLSKAEETFTVDVSSKPDAVILDPDYDFLREIPNLHWSAAELPAIVRYAPNAVDRSEALNRMLAGTPSDEAVRTAVEVLSADNGQFPAFPTTSRLGDLKRADLRTFFRAQTAHPDFNRRTDAINALAKLPSDPADSELLRKLVNDSQPYSVVEAALTTLSSWDPAGSRALVFEVTNMPSRHETLRGTAYKILVDTKAPETVGILIRAAAPGNSIEQRQKAIEYMGKLDRDEERTREELGKALHDQYGSVVLAAAQAFGARKDTSALTELRLVHSKPPADSPDWIVTGIADQIKALEAVK